METLLGMKFREFDQANPKVWELFEKFTLEAIRAGRKHLGVAMVIERLRWYSSVETGGDMFKLNNTHNAFYVRKFEYRYPEYKGFFRKRKSVADCGVA